MAARPTVGDVNDEDVDDAEDAEDAEGEAGEVVFELAEWGEEFRAAVGKVLDERGIPFDWEGTDLVVDEEDADLVDELLDHLETEPLDEIIPVEDTPPAENEATYDDVSALFLAADRFLRAPDDPALARALDDAAAALAGTAPPFGLADREWARILAVTSAVRDALAEAADPELAAGDARNLRDLLRVYV